MTRTTNARLAGFTFLFYIAIGLGVAASLLLVVTLGVQLAGFLHGPATYYMWIPMAVFEVALGLWLLIKGVAAPRQ